MLGRMRHAALAAVLLAASAAAQPPAPEYRGTGTVIALLPAPSSLHATRPVIVIQHRPIPGLMDEEMSMPFIAASADLFRGLAVGDRIDFTLRDVPGALLVVTIRKTAR